MDAIDRRRWAIGDDRKYFDSDHALAQYPLVFRDYGVDPKVQPLGKLVAVVRQSAISNQLSLALGSWWGLDKSKELLKLIDVLDPDPERTALRAAYLDKKQADLDAMLVGLLGQSLPPSFAQFIGDHPRTPSGLAISILKKTQAAHRNHFGLAIRTAIRLPKERFDDKIAYYRIALALDPDSTFCLGNLGMALREKGDFDGAIFALREEVRLDSNNAIAHHNLGAALMDKQDLDGAIRALQEAIRLDPKLAITHFNLGILLTEMGNDSGAFAAFEAAVRLKIDMVGPHKRLASELGKRDVPFAALRVLREAAQFRPRWFDDYRTSLRFETARFAILAGSGRGKDAPSPSERPELLNQALNWLSADLAAWRIASSDPATRPLVHDKMTL